VIADVVGGRIGPRPRRSPINAWVNVRRTGNHRRAGEEALAAVLLLRRLRTSSHGGLLLLPNGGLFVAARSRAWQRARPLGYQRSGECNRARPPIWRPARRRERAHKNTWRTAALLMQCAGVGQRHRATEPLGCWRRRSRARAGPERSRCREAVAGIGCRHVSLRAPEGLVAFETAHARKRSHELACAARSG
jgi:hypothetical protein